VADPQDTMNIDPAAVQPNNLCKICQRIRPQLHVFFKDADSLKEERYPYHKSLAEVQESSSQGCHLCNLVLGAIGISTIDAIDGFVLSISASAKSLMRTQC
jgi:hypothetical protein